MDCYRLLRYIGMPAVASITTGVVLAQSPVEDVPVAQSQSEHFNAVASQLELGGLKFSYSDGDAINSFYAGSIRMVAQYLDRHTEFKGVDAEKLITLMKVGAAKASGSSASQRDGFVHYRNFSYMPEGLSLNAQSYLDKAPSMAVKLAPQGADLVLEAHMNSNFDPTLEAKFYDALGPVGVKLKEETAKQKKNKVYQEWEKIARTINSRFVVVLDISPKGFKGVKGMPMGVQALVSVTNAEKIWAAAKPMLKEQGVEVIVNGDLEEIKFPLEESMNWAGCLQYDTKTKQLYMASTPEYLALCQDAAAGKAPSLSVDPEFLKVNEGLPAQYSGVAYVSPSFAGVALSLFEGFGMPQIEKEQYVGPAVRMLLEKLKVSDVTKTGTMYAASIQDKGVLHVVNSPVQIPELGNQATMAATLGGVSTLFVGAKYYRDSANKAACVINLTNIHKATRAVQNIEGREAGSPFKWEMIVGEGKPIESRPSCPEGGTYTLSGVIPETGKAAAECSCAGHAPTSTEGW